MAEEFEIIRANLLPAAGTITDNDMILIIQGGRPKRALPSAMKGKQGDPGLSAFLGINDKYILWKQGANGAWQNLLEIEKIRGPKGEKPVFRKLNGTLQMKYEGEPDSAYVDIFDREESAMRPFVCPTSGWKQSFSACLQPAGGICQTSPHNIALFLYFAV